MNIPSASSHITPIGAMSTFDQTSFKSISATMQPQSRVLAQSSVPINVSASSVSATGLKSNGTRTLQQQTSLAGTVQQITSKASVYHKKLDRSFSEPAERKCLVTVAATAVPQQQQQQGGSVSTRYKTELCRSFVESGVCKYGEKCQFAHGNDELRSITRHPKFKTENCRRFHTVGFCPYGSRCHFIHNGEEEQRKFSFRYDASVSPSNCSSSNGSTSANFSPSISGAFGSSSGLVRQNASFFSDSSSPTSPNSATAFCPVSNFNSVEPGMDSLLVRPKALSFGSTSLGSSGEISTASSSSQSPTSHGSFFSDVDAMFNVPTLQSAFSASPDSFGKFSWTSGFGGSPRSLKPDEANSDIPDSLLFNLVDTNTQQDIINEKSFFDHYPSVPVSPSVDSVNSELEALKICPRSSAGTGSNISELSGYSPVSAFSPAAEVSRNPSSQASAFNRYDSFFSTPPSACNPRARLPTFAKFSNNLQQ